MRAAFLIAMLVVVLMSTVQAAIFSSTDPVTTITDANFDKLVTKSKEVWVLMFYADYCGHCKNSAPAFVQSCKALNGIAKCGVVDGTANQQLGSKFQVQGFPTFKIFGSDRTTPIDYNGAREAKPIASAVLKEIRATISSRLDGGDGAKKSNNNNNNNKASGSGGNNNGGAKGGANVQLTAQNFKNEVISSPNVWLVAFKASWCGHCKAMASDWIAAAKEFSPSSPIRFGEIDCPTHQSVCGDYGVQGYPTIKLFINGKPTDYNGGRNKDDFVRFMKQQEGKAKPTPKPIELTTQGEFDKCMEDSICIFASLPDIRDSTVEERNNYIKVLTEAAAKNKKHQISWVYSFARLHRDFENAVGIGQNGFPAIVLIHKGKAIYSPLYRSFTLDNINDWANKAGNGQVTQAIKYESLPAIQNVPLWDKKAYTPKDEL